MPLTQVRNELERRKRETARIAARTIDRRLNENVPVKTRQLKRSIEVNVRESGRGIKVIPQAGGPDIIQALTTEKGARPHKIVARRAKALTFYWPKVGRVVSFKSVNHPGNPPMPWFYPVVNDWSRIVRDAWRKSA